jgi:hypothetical protein
MSLLSIALSAFQPTVPLIEYRVYRAIIFLSKLILVAVMFVGREHVDRHDRLFQK